MKATGFNTRQDDAIRSAFVRRNWHLLILLPALVIGIAVSLAVLEAWSLKRWIDPPLVVAFILGAGGAAAVAVVLTALGMDGARSYRDGQNAEEWTAATLKPLRKQGWSVVHDVEFDRTNVDHVLIGPHGAIAVETKFRNAEWRLSDRGIHEAGINGESWEVHHPIRAAQRHARKLRSLLVASGVKTNVLPVLVLWGPRVDGVSHALIDGVLVVRGGHADAWIDHLESEPLTDHETVLAERAVSLRKAGKEVGPPSNETSVLAALASEPDRSAAPTRSNERVPVLGLH